MGPAGSGWFSGGLCSHGGKFDPWVGISRGCLCGAVIAPLVLLFSTDASKQPWPHQLLLQPCVRLARLACCTVQSYTPFQFLPTIGVRLRLQPLLLTPVAI